MRLVWLSANAAWSFVFGSSIEYASIQDMGDFGRFFETRQEACDAASCCGITVDKQGNCTVQENN